MADELTGVEVGTAYITVLPDARDFHKKLAAETDQAAARAGQSGGDAFAGGFGKALPVVTGAIAGIFTVDKVKEFVSETINAASDLAESQSKVDVVFGRSANIIEQWSQTSATSVLLSKQAALEATGTFGNLFTAMDISQQKAADLARGSVQLSADLASFNNRDVADTLEAVRSGLVGETEPLRSLGINLNQARIQQEALNEKLWDGHGRITAAAQAQAAYNLMLHDAKNALGDVDRTASGYANTTRAIQAAIEDAKAEIGGGFLTGLQAVSREMGGPDGIVGLIKQWSDGVADIVAGMGYIAAKTASTFGGAGGGSNAAPPPPKTTNFWEVGGGGADALGLWSGNPILQVESLLGFFGNNARADQYNLEQLQAEADRVKYMRETLAGQHNKSMFEADDQTAAKAYADSLGTVADRAVFAATGIGTLQAALDEFDAKSKTRQAGVTVRDQWRALDTMGDTVSEKYKVKNPKWRHGSLADEFITKTRQVQRDFDPDVDGGRFAYTKTGDQARSWATDIGQAVATRAQMFDDPARAQSFIDQWAKKLGGQFKEWGVDRPYAYARSFLPGADAYSSEIANRDTLATRNRIRESDRFEFHNTTIVTTPDADVVEQAKQQAFAARGSRVPVPHGAIR